jgi:hypothetical protein
MTAPRHLAPRVARQRGGRSAPRRPPRRPTREPGATSTPRRPARPAARTASRRPCERPVRPPAPLGRRGSRPSLRRALPLLLLAWAALAAVGLLPDRPAAAAPIPVALYRDQLAGIEADLRRGDWLAARQQAGRLAHERIAFGRGEISPDLSVLGPLAAARTRVEADRLVFRLAALVAALPVPDQPPGAPPGSSLPRVPPGTAPHPSGTSPPRAPSGTTPQGAPPGTTPHPSDTSPPRAPSGTTPQGAPPGIPPGSVRSIPPQGSPLGIPPGSVRSIPLPGAPPDAATGVPPATSPGSPPDTAAADAALLARLRREQALAAIPRGGRLPNPGLRNGGLLAAIRDFLQPPARLLARARARFIAWLERWLRSLSATRSGGRPVFGLPGMVALALGLALAMLAAGALAVRRGGRSGKTRALATSLPAPARDEDPLSRGAAEWESYARALAAAGRFREAIRAWYHAVLVTLYQGGALHFRPGRTNWEYVSTVPSGTPWRPALIEITRHFEREWYGRDHSSAEALAASQETATRLLAALRRSPR